MMVEEMMVEIGRDAGDNDDDDRCNDNVTGLAAADEHEWKRAIDSEEWREMIVKLSARPKRRCLPRPDPEPHCHIWVSLSDSGPVVQE